MESGLAHAYKKAGFKLGGGLMLIAAMLGVRIIVATPDGVEAEIAELEQVEDEFAAEQPTSERRSSPVPASAAKSDSIVSRMGAGVRGQLSGSGRVAPDADRLVSCALGGATQFMRAADCATRGGTSTDVD